MKYILYLFTSILFISCAEIIYVDDISKKQVNIIIPQNGVTIQDSVVTFSWSEIQEAESYHIQMVTPDFSQATSLLLDSMIFSTQYSMPIDSGIYQWRVKAVNTEYETPYSMYSFEVKP